MGKGLSWFGWQGRSPSHSHPPCCMYVLLEPALLLTLRKSIILCQDEREKPALLASIHEMRTLVQLKHAKVLVAQSCLKHFATPWTPGSSVHGILQARILEWVAIPFSRGSPQPRDPTQVSCIAGGFFTI